MNKNLSGFRHVNEGFQKQRRGSLIFLATYFNFYTADLLYNVTKNTIHHPHLLQ